MSSSSTRVAEQAGRQSTTVGRIDRELLDDLSRHTRKLGIGRRFKSMGYERCGELPLIVSRLKPLFDKPLKYLDIGSGESVFPSYLLKRTKWDISCLDKFSWVQRQHGLARRVMGNEPYRDRLHVIEKDLFHIDLPAESFDVITNISVIEHFDGNTDSQAMERSARLLKKGGLYILTTPFNSGRFREFNIKSSVYGEKYETKPVFFQRHHDERSFEDRILRPSGLKEKERLYFGDYGFQFYERFIWLPSVLKPVKASYQWASPYFARRFMSYRDYPVARDDMKMCTASGIFVVLEKS